MTQAPIRLAELMAALSLATDLGMGQPVEFAWQSCVVAMRLGEALKFSEAELRGVYYQSLLRYIGCNAETRLLAAVFGDELALRADIIHADAAGPEFRALSLRFVREAQAGAPPLQMLAAVVGGLAQMARASKEFFTGHCEVAGRLAERLGLEPEIVASLRQVYARWDGKGIPALKGEAIAPGMLVVSLMTLIDSLNAHDMSQWAARLAPGFSAVHPGASGLNAQGARMFNESFLPAFPNLHFDVTRSMVASDSVIIEWRAGGTHDGPLTNAAGQTIPPTHRAGAISGVLISDVKDGQIIRERTYWDQMELLGQLGVV